ncbi:MAG: hypothetical protein ACM3KR_07295 [Deltaproteobacteria bacterium]
MGFGSGAGVEGVAGLMSGAGKNMDVVLFTFKGDLRQMAEQQRALQDAGIQVLRRDVYPGVKTEEDFIKALTIIWTQRVEGWWHYKERYAQYGICTKNQYNRRLWKCIPLPVVIMTDERLVSDWKEFWSLLEQEGISINDAPLTYQQGACVDGGREPNKIFLDGTAYTEPMKVPVSIGDVIKVKDKEIIVSE